MLFSLSHSQRVSLFALTSDTNGQSNCSIEYPWEKAEKQRERVTGPRVMWCFHQWPTVTLHSTNDHLLSLVLSYINWCVSLSNKLYNSIILKQKPLFVLPRSANSKWSEACRPVSSIEIYLLWLSFWLSIMKICRLHCSHTSRRDEILFSSSAGLCKQSNRVFLSDRIRIFLFEQNKRHKEQLFI